MLTNQQRPYNFILFMANQFRIETATVLLLFCFKFLRVMSPRSLLPNSFYSGWYFFLGYKERFEIQQLSKKEMYWYVIERVLDH